MIPANNPEPDRILWNGERTREELAVSKRKIAELVASGELPVVRIGRCVRFRPEDVREYVDRLAAEARR